MTDLFNRDFALKIGVTPLEIHAPTIPIVEDDKAVTTLRVAFNITKDSNRDPNKAEITLYNLNLAHRQLFQQYADVELQTWPVTVEAGYIGTRQLIFLGDIQNVSSHKEGVTWITTIQASDGGKKYASARFNQSFGPGSSVVTVLSAVILAFGIGPGNAIKQIAKSPRGFTTFAKGVVVSGRISDILDKYISSVGYQWSIQDNQLQVLQPSQATGEPVVLLNQYTGLIGSPEMSEKGKITFRSLLQGSIKPGRRLAIESNTANGVFVDEKVQYLGDTWGTDWYAIGEAAPEKLVA
jgi:hypothetical protein